MTVPFFICPGAQKSATTWLYFVLKSHPDFWMPPVKEFDYLADLPVSRKKMLDRYKRERPTCHPAVADWWDLFAQERSLAKYLDLIASDKIMGDISPNYTYAPEAAPNASALVPHAKIIIFLRHPVDRAWSHARMVAKEQGRDLTDTDWIMNYAVGEWASIMGNYPDLVGTWRQHFGDQVHLFRYEDIEADPVSQLNKFLALFDAKPIDETFPPLHKRANVGPVVEIPDRDKIAEHHRAAIEFYEELFPEAHSNERQSV